VLIDMESTRFTTHNDDRLLPNGTCAGSRDLFNLCEIADNVSEVEEARYIANRILPP